MKTRAVNESCGQTRCKFGEGQKMCHISICKKGQMAFMISCEMCIFTTYDLSLWDEKAQRAKTFSHRMHTKAKKKDLILTYTEDELHEIYEYDRCPFLSRCVVQLNDGGCF